LGSGGVSESEDPFLHGIDATAGPAAQYKENRASGLYKKVFPLPSTPLSIRAGDDL